MDPEAENGKAFLPSRCKTKVKLQEENKKNPTNQPNQKTNFGTGIQDLDSWFPTCYIEPLQ